MNEFHMGSMNVIPDINKPIHKRHHQRFVLKETFLTQKPYKWVIVSNIEVLNIIKPRLSQFYWIHCTWAIAKQFSGITSMILGITCIQLLVCSVLSVYPPTRTGMLLPHYSRQPCIMMFTYTIVCRVSKFGTIFETFDQSKNSFDKL